MPNPRTTALAQGKQSRADFLAAYARHRDLDQALDACGRKRSWLYKNTARWADFKGAYQAMRRTVAAPGENDQTPHAVDWDHSFSGFRSEFLGRQSPWFHEQISEAMDAQAGGDIMLVICPPESGKTSMAEDRCTMDVCTDPTTRITIGKSKIDFAKLMVATVRQRLTTGVREYWKLHERFGPFMPMLGVNAFQQPQVWTQDAFNVFKRKLGAERDFNMVALGFGAEVAGTRTDRLYLDDVQSRKTLNLTDKILETMRDDWLTRPGTTGNTTILMNVVGDDDIADRLFDDQLLTNRFIYKAYDEQYLELGPRPTKDGGWDVSPWLWPERYSEADYERMRAIAGPEGWARKYQQDWRPSVGRSFTQDMIDLCQNELRRISHPPPRHPADKPAEIACSIDPAFKRTAVASAAFEPTILRFLDTYAESNLRTTGQMIDMLVDQIRHWHRPGVSAVKWVIVETKGMQKGLITDDKLLELQAEIGFEIISQETGWDKHDEDFGVAQMARSMTRAEIDFPAGDQESIDRFEDLYREMKNWRPEIRAQNRGNKLRQDRLMSGWFLFTRWHKQRRRSIKRGADASQFGFGALPTMPGLLVPSPVRAPDLSGWRFGQTVGGR